MNFAELSKKYDATQMDEEKRKAIITSMQENLKGRLKGKDGKLNINGKEYSVNSESVEDLRVIDRFLQATDRKCSIEDLNTKTRISMTSRNTYNENNKYTGN